MSPTPTPVAATRIPGPSVASSPRILWLIAAGLYQMRTAGAVGPGRRVAWWSRPLGQVVDVVQCECGRLLEPRLVVGGAADDVDRLPPERHQPTHRLRHDLLRLST